MAASYPTAQKTFTTKASADVIQASHINDLQDEVVAVEQGLISGLSHTVKPGTTNLYDLGSTSLKWRILYLSGTASVSGAVTLSSTVAVAGRITYGTTPSGFGTYDTGADDLILQGSANVGLSLITDSALGGASDRTQMIAFGAAGINAADAWMRYSTSARTG